jgi:hypothetical protein
MSNVTGWMQNWYTFVGYWVWLFVLGATYLIQCFIWKDKYGYMSENSDKGQFTLDETHFVLCPVISMNNETEI